MFVLWSKTIVFVPISSMRFMVKVLFFILPFSGVPLGSSIWRNLWSQTTGVRFLSFFISLLNPFGRYHWSEGYFSYLRSKSIWSLPLVRRLFFLSALKSNYYWSYKVFFTLICVISLTDYRKVLFFTLKSCIFVIVCIRFILYRLYLLSLMGAC